DDEVAQVVDVCKRWWCFAGSNCSDAVPRLRQQRIQVQRQAALDDGARQRQRIATQRERVLVAGRLQARGETAGERVEAFGDGQHAAQRRRRDVVARVTRLVGLVDRVGDLGRLARGRGV